MKIKLFLLTVLTVLMAACNDDAEVLYGDMKQIQDDIALTRSIDGGSQSDGILSVDSVTDKIRNLKEILNRINTRNKAVSLEGNDDYDQWFYSNFYAIRELPITIQARSVASGSGKSNIYLSCYGKGQEVILESDTSSENGKFFLKVLPPSAGIPYIIYSLKSKTPLTVGHYNSTPNTKILMSQPNDNNLSDYGGWDLIPVTNSNGYFSIKNTSYLGQYDESKPLSIFNYHLEAISGNKLGFAPPENNKLQQQFKIIPCNEFSFSSIEYDLSTATLKKSTETHYGTGQNLSTENALVNVNFKFDADETSRFDRRNSISVRLNQDTVELPLISGGAIMLPGSDMNQTPKTAPLSYDNTYHFHRKIEYTLKRNCPARKNIKIKAYFVKYDVSIKFTAKAYLKMSDGDERKFTLSGTWTGTLYENPNIIEPTKEDPTYTNIGGGGTDIPIILPGTRTIDPIDSPVNPHNP